MNKTPHFYFQTEYCWSTFHGITWGKELGPAQLSQIQVCRKLVNFYLGKLIGKIRGHMANSSDRVGIPKLSVFLYLIETYILTYKIPEFEWAQNSRFTISCEDTL